MGITNMNRIWIKEIDFHIEIHDYNAWMEKELQSTRETWEQKMLLSYWTFKRD